MKTLDECKQEICARFAHPDWNAIIESCKDKNNDVFNHVVDSLCELYADEAQSEVAKCMTPNAMKH